MVVSRLLERGGDQTWGRKGGAGVAEIQGHGQGNLGFWKSQQARLRWAGVGAGGGEPPGCSMMNQSRRLRDH